MELKKYINKKVKVDLKNGFYYEGFVQSADDNSISIKDKFGKDIDLTEDSISFMRELE
jgi:sRNA-binding regulator protein Hfq